MSASEFKLGRDRWCEQIARIADGGYYASEARSLNYFKSKLEPEWQTRLRRGVEDDLVKSLGLSSTMLMILHLAARGCRRHGAGDRKAPRFKHWPPYSEGGAVRFLRAFPMSDIATVIGRSKSAVRIALARFRRSPRSSAESVFSLNRLAGFPPLKSGILLDVVIVEPADGQLSFGFAYEDYQGVLMWAAAKGADDFGTRAQSMKWAREGIRNVAPNLIQLPTTPVEVVGELFRSSPEEAAPATPQKKQGVSK